jgi:GDPmannose 4,6-dehydratase
MKALITGVNGQDGFYLKKHLEKLDYKIIGIDVDSSESLGNFDEVEKLLQSFEPDEIYHLAAYHQSSEDKGVNDLEIFQKSYESNILSTANILEAMLRHGKKSRLFYANSCLLFGEPSTFPQNENTPLNPQCLYGFSKYQGLKLCQLYREKYGLFVSNGFLYNHESPRRPTQFVTQKIVQKALEIKRTGQGKLVLGDLDAQVDWLFAGDVVKAMHLILKADRPQEFVIASGILRKIRDFVRLTFEELDLRWEDYIEVDPTLLTRNRSKTLVGDSTLLSSVTGWNPETTFENLIKIMVQGKI